MFLKTLPSCAEEGGRVNNAMEMEEENTVELEQLQGRRRGSGEAGSVQRRRLTQLKIAKMVQE